MNIHKIMAISLTLMQFPSFAANADYQLEFGVIIQNQNGEPVGFEKTTNIPIRLSGEPSLYGLVVTCPDSSEFVLSSVHILPSQQAGDTPRKLMGKPMRIQTRGAIFMRTDNDDIPGQYSIEIYINNSLHQVIDYQLITNTALNRF